MAFAFFGLRPLGEPDEGRYAETAREMAVGGDWLIPHLQGQPHLTKPAFTYWITALGLRLLGINEWGARLFLSCAFFLTILAVVALARTWGWSESEARASGLIFSTAILPWISGHLLTTDMFLACWETLGVLCAWRVWRGEGSAGPWRLGFWLAFALAFLTKGPPGWLPLLVILAFVLLSRRRAARAGLWSWPGLALFLAVSLAWYLAVIHRLGLTELRYFLHDEVYNRVFTNEHGREKPVWFYFPVLLLGLAPWLWLWVPLLRRTGQTLWTGTGLTASWRRLRNLEERRLFSLLWVLIPFAVFTLARSRMYLYVVPLFVPVALWAGRLLARSWPPCASAWRRAAVAALALWALALIGFNLLPERAFRGKSRRALSRELLARLPGPRERIQLYALSDPSHSISFYTGLLSRKVDELDADEVVRFLREEAREGRIGLVELRSKKIRKLEPGACQVLADDGEMAVVALAEMTAPASNMKSPQ